MTGWTASTTCVLQLLFPCLCLCLALCVPSSSSSLKGVRPDVDGESEGGACLIVVLVVDQRVNGHHLQVQRVLSGPWHGTGQHQHGTDVIDLLGKTENNSVKAEWHLHWCSSHCHMSKCLHLKRLITSIWGELLFFFKNLHIHTDVFHLFQLIKILLRLTLGCAYQSTCTNKNGNRVIFALNRS